MTRYLIDRLGHTGDGIADGPIYAAGALPGEVVTGDLEGNRLNNIKIDQPSTARVAPPCRHGKTCGGCSLQHARADFVGQWKVSVVSEALAAHGLPFELAGLHTSDAYSRRRAVLTGQKTKKGALIGYFARGSHVLVDIQECHVLDPAILSARPLLEQLTRRGGTRNENVRFALTVTLGGLDVSAHGPRTLDADFFAELAALGSDFGIARLSWNEEIIATYQPAEVAMGRARVVPPPGAFLQATQAGERVLLDRVMNGVAGSEKVVDLFAGCGTFSLPLCELSQVHAVEGEQMLLDAAHQAWRQTGGALKQFTIEKRDLFRRPLMPDELKAYDAAVLDPPRAGAVAQVAEIAISGLQNLVYVSCNPISFARDAAALVQAGFKMGGVDVVDQFRWSTHVELVTEFTRK